MHIKVLNRWSNKSFDMLLELLLDAFPNGTSIPKSHYDMKKMMRDFGLGYDSIHACKCGCALFWKENENLHNCPVCGEPRYNVRAPPPGPLRRGVVPLTGYRGMSHALFFRLRESSNPRPKGHIEMGSTLTTN